MFHCLGAWPPSNNLRGVAFLFQALGELFGIALIEERPHLNGQLHASGPGNLHWRVRGRCGISRRRGGRWRWTVWTRRPVGRPSAPRPQELARQTGVAATAGAGAAAGRGGRRASRSITSGHGILGYGRRRLHRGNLPPVERNECALRSPIHASQESRGKDQDDQQQSAGTQSNGGLAVQ